MEAIRKPSPHMGRVLPEDRYNAELVANVHPPGRVNPDPAPRYNLVVVGAGTAGLVAAAGAAGLGAKVALVERHLLGGDCLNVGGGPSKGLIRSSRVMHDIRDAARYGVSSRDGFEADFPAVMERMRRLRAHISHHDSVQRFAGLGVDVFLGEARVSGPETVEGVKKIVETYAKNARKHERIGEWIERRLVRWRHTAVG